MRLSTIAKLFRVMKIVITLVLAMVSFLWILELHQTEMEQKTELENLNAKLENLTGSTTHSLIANYKLWRCEWTGQYFIVQNLALHTLETIVTVDHPKTAHHYSFELQLSEYFKWRVPLFEKINYNQQDVYVQEGTKPLIVPGKKLVVNFDFKEAFNISSLVVKLGEEILGRPTIFRYKISGVQPIEHILPLEGSIFEYDVPQRAYLQASQVSCELEIPNSSAATFLSIEGIGVYGVMKF